MCFHRGGRKGDFVWLNLRVQYWLKITYRKLENKLIFVEFLSEKRVRLSSKHISLWNFFSSNFILFLVWASFQYTNQISPSLVKKWGRYRVETETIQMTTPLPQHIMVGYTFNVYNCISDDISWTRVQYIHRNYARFTQSASCVFFLRFTSKRC